MLSFCMFTSSSQQIFLNEQHHCYIPETPQMCISMAPSPHYDHLFLLTQCADHKVEALCEALQASVQQWRGRFPSPLPLELYTSSNFIGLFVEEQVADILKLFAADFAAEAVRKAGKKYEREGYLHPQCFLILKTCVFLSVCSIFHSVSPSVSITSLLSQSNAC